MVDLDGHLLMHSDTDAYLEFGDSIASINAAITAALGSEDIDLWWELLHRLTTRHIFARDGGRERAAALTQQLGVRRIVHGHSIIGSLVDRPSEQVEGPFAYADGLVLAIDGGRYDGGPLLLVELH